MNIVKYKIGHHSNRITMRLLKYIVLTITVALLYSCGSKEQPEATEAHHEEEENAATLTEAQIKTAGITLGKIERRPTVYWMYLPSNL
jgi:hypothetical protein